MVVSLGKKRGGLETIREDDLINKRLENVSGSSLSLDSQSSDTPPPASAWYSCKPPMRSFNQTRSFSEASVYRTGSKYSIKSISQTGKTLDFLMQCFWTCSPGCQQTAQR